MLPARILIATDGSESAIAAEAYAAELAAAIPGARLVVMSVIEEEQRLRDPFEPDDQSGMRAVVEAAEARIRALLGSRPVPVETRLAMAASPEEIAVDEALREKGVATTITVPLAPSPAAAILAEANAGDLCQIVLGHRDHGGLERGRLGPVSSQVVREARCPVTVVRA
ncbi:MAG TPA: universal stress protein [Thermoleophilia bacterium]|nr:universal stress protein [Thermoleophilia bacterium]